MLTESEIIGWCHALFRQKKRRRDVAMERCMAEAGRVLAQRRYWRDAEDRDAWEKACDPSIGT